MTSGLQEHTWPWVGSWAREKLLEGTLLGQLRSFEYRLWRLDNNISTVELLNGNLA